MKIAYIFTQFPSGQVSNSTRVFSMLERGHEVTVFANSKGKSVLYEDELKKYSNVLTIIYFDQSLFEIAKIIVRDAIVSPITFVKSIIKVSNKKFFYQHYTKRIIGGSRKKSNLLITKKKSKVLTSYLRYRAVKDVDFDLVISFFGTVGNNYLFIKELYPQTKYLTYFVGFDYSSQIYRTHDVNFYKDLFKYADYICAKSNFSKQTLIGLGCSEEKLILDYNGIDTTKFSVKTFEEPPYKTIKLIIVSRLEKKKCHLLILQALQNILKEHKNFKFTIVGDGPEKNVLQEFLAKDEELFNRVDLVGKKTQFQVKSLLQNHHVFIHPSSSSLLNGSMEDTPTSILEAMTIGLPIISTYHAGIPDLVIDDFNGKLVPERNLKLLHEAILAFFKDNSLVNFYGKNSRALVEEHFDSRINAEKNEKFYKSII